MDVFNLREGNSPLIISSPHAGTYVPDEIKALFTEEAQSLPDTDWHVDRLYDDFASAEDVTFIRANYSRYVIDLNRPPDDTPLYPGQVKVPLCPDKTFDGVEIYREGCAPDAAEIEQRLKLYWRPYHAEIERQIERALSVHGIAILYDAHSIRQSVPRLFDGILPDLNIGTAGGKSCAPEMAEKVMAAAEASRYSAVLNGRFIGGYITRAHGAPERNVHALQMELAQVNYMDERSFDYDAEKAADLKAALEQILHAVTDYARARVKAKSVG